MASKPGPDSASIAGSWRLQAAASSIAGWPRRPSSFVGDAVFYDPDDPFQGYSRDGGFGFTLQPSGRLSQGFDYRRVDFDRCRDRERVFYDLDLIYSRTTL